MHLIFQFPLSLLCLNLFLKAPRLFALSFFVHRFHNAGRDIYNKLFKTYTEKQWGTSAADLSPSVISRIPFRFNHDTRYFEDPYQGMPKEGFTKMCEKMIENDNINVGLKSDYKQYIDKINP